MMAVEIIYMTLSVGTATPTPQDFVVEIVLGLSYTAKTALSRCMLEIQYIGFR
jgi:hypothetical protein